MFSKQKVIELFKTIKKYYFPSATDEYMLSQLLTIEKLVLDLDNPDISEFYITYFADEASLEHLDIILRKGTDEQILNCINKLSIKKIALKIAKTNSLWLNYIFILSVFDRHYPDLEDIKENLKVLKRAEYKVYNDFYSKYHRELYCDEFKRITVKIKMNYPHKYDDLINLCSDEIEQEKSLIPIVKLLRKC